MVRTKKSLSEGSEEGLDLDDFMEAIKESADAGSKENVSKLKLQLSTLQKEKLRVDKLVEVTRPNKMPDLKPNQTKAKPLTIGKMFGATKPVISAAKPEAPQPTKVLARPNKAFADEDEDESEAKKPKLQSLEQLKKDIEEEKSKPLEEQQPKKKSKKAKLNNTAAIVQQVKESEAAPKSYTQLANEDEKYQTWVPPKGQTGDGRTSLNDKLGY